MIRRLIEEYSEGAFVPAREIEGLSREELNAYPIPNTWSIQQIVVHLLDSDLIGADRMKRVIAEERPTLVAYDESAFARSLFYDAADLHKVCEVFAKNRQLMAEILRRLPESAFSRIGIHSETGPVTLESLVRAYVDHLRHHVSFIAKKRQLLGRC